MAEQDLIEVKFRLFDGTDIGPTKYIPSASVASLKEKIISHWPKDKAISPRDIHDLKLINAGKILENNRTLAKCILPIELPGGIINMHVVVCPPLLDKNKSCSMIMSRCLCSKEWFSKEHEPMFMLDVVG